MKLEIKVLSLVLALGLVACDNGAKQQGGKQGANEDGGDDEGEAEASDDSTDGNSVPAGDGDFDGWCAKAAEIQPVQGQLGDMFTKFCNGGKATKLLKSTLVSSAYSGSGTPKLKQVEKLSSDKEAKETSAYFAVGIKLPISIQQHFDKVGPKAGDKESAKRLAEAQKAKMGKFEVKDEFKEDGKYHVRGWRIHGSTISSAGGIELKTETIARSDQFELEKGSLYAYTQITEEGIETVKEFDLLTAGIQVGDSGYLLALAKLKVGNRGLASVAESKIKDTAVALVKSMYKAGEEGAGLRESERAEAPQED